MHVKGNEVLILEDCGTTIEFVSTAIVDVTGLGVLSVNGKTGHVTLDTEDLLTQPYDFVGAVDAAWSI